MSSFILSITIKVLSIIMFCVFPLSYSFTVDLIHPNSPRNPFRHASKSRFDYIREAFHHSQMRAAYIKRRVNGDHSSKFETDLRPAPGGYIMKYSIGTPPFETYGIADTGSDITWTQCKPCSDCFEQTIPMFDPRRSNSYKTVSCDSASCNSQSFSCGERDNCAYKVTYGDQSKTVGDVAVDTLTLGDSSFKNVLFGCGHIDSGTFNNDTSGIVGLGGNGATSIISQLDKQISGKFAYCLSPDPSGTSHISFGDDAVVSGDDTVSTPLIKKPSQETFYWLTLESITVGDKTLNAAKAKPKNSPIGRRDVTDYEEGNIIIDSGTTLTYLPSDLYDDFVSAMEAAIPATPVRSPQQPFGLCYATRENFEVPRIVAHFAGADMELSPKGIFVEVEEGLVCLTIVSNAGLGGDVAIFGNLSEIDYIVAYDLVEKTVTFKPSPGCSTF